MEKELIRFSVIRKTELPDFEEKHDRRAFVSWGNSNDFPQRVYDIYGKSPIFTSIVGAMKDYILGDGIVTTDAIGETVNRKGETFKDIVSRCVVDRAIFGGFAIQIIRNSLHEIAELNWLDMRNVRVDEDESVVFYNRKWDGGKKKAVEYEMYRKGEKQPVSVYYYKGRNTRGVYPVPDWIGALKSLMITTEIDNYNFTNITNNFTPSSIVNFNNGDNLPEDVMDEIETKMYSKFVGSDTAGRIMLSFNADKDHAVSIERLPDDGLENKYQLLNENTSKNIYSAFRINPCLLGYNQENMGFNVQEFDSAFKLYNKTVIQPLQKEVIDAMEKIFGKGCMTIKPFTIDFGNNGTQNNETEEKVE